MVLELVEAGLLRRGLKGRFTLPLRQLLDRGPLRERVELQAEGRAAARRRGDGGGGPRAQILLEFRHYF